MATMADLKGKKFLIVDDMRTMRGIVRKCLMLNGITKIVEATNGVEACQLLDSDPEIDFIISDWNMPQMTGIEFLKKTREHERYSDIPFLMLTAEQDASQVGEAIRSGVDGYIIKPFTADILVKRITGIWGKKSKAKAS